tara:strand:- start:104 stop:619 length:516 start_codon:yes stop_codon:yes gene_type:complete
MEEETLIEASLIEGRYLSSKVSPGLFLASRNGMGSVPFLVVGDKVRYSILLDRDSESPFRADALEENSMGWPGSYVGPVEFLVDMQSQKTAYTRPVPGDLAFSKEGLVLMIRSGQLPRSLNGILVKEMHVDDGMADKINFSKWALFQRNSDGTRRVLYRHGNHDSEKVSDA